MAAKMNKHTDMETWRGFQGCGAFNESFLFFFLPLNTKQKKHSSYPRKRKISPVLCVMLGGDSHERPEREWRESHGKAESEGRGRWERKQGIKGQSGHSKGWRNMGGVYVSVYVFPCPYRQHAHWIKAPLPQLHLANEKHCYTTLTATPLREQWKEEQERGWVSQRHYLVHGYEDKSPLAQACNHKPRM